MPSKIKLRSKLRIYLQLNAAVCRLFIAYDALCNWNIDLRHNSGPAEYSKTAARSFLSVILKSDF